MSLRFERISKTLSGEHILQSCSFELDSHQIALLIGANGAGKSTLLKIAAGLLQADGGKVLWNGTERKRYANTLGYLGHQSFLFGDLTVEENLSLYAKVRGFQKGLEFAREYWQLEKLLGKRARELSKGQLFRGGLACALIAEPELILLDEPSASLDDSSLCLLAGYLEQRRSCGPVAALIATHDLSRLLDLSDRVMFLQDGGIAADSGLQAANKAEVVAAYRERNR